MTTLLHENFKSDHGVLNKFGVVAGDSSFDFTGPNCEFMKLSTGYNMGGFQTFGYLNVTSNHRFELVFKPQTLNSGTEFQMILSHGSNPTNLQQGYGLMIQGTNALALNGSAGAVATQAGVTNGKNYRLILAPRPDSDLDVFLVGFNMPHAGGFLGTIPGPFLNRDTIFAFNCHSQETIILQDFEISGP